MFLLYLDTFSSIEYYTIDVIEFGDILRLSGTTEVEIEVFIYGRGS